MSTGRVLQFDHVRGYGFVAADDGGEDVFLHASVFDGDPDELAPGARMEFNVMASDRGRKAFAAHLLDDEPADDFAAPSQPVASPAAVASPVSVASPVPSPRPYPRPSPSAPVVSRAELGQELTEALLIDVPSLTGKQVLEVRDSLLKSAEKHGWVDS